MAQFMALPAASASCSSRTDTPDSGRTAIRGKLHLLVVRFALIFLVGAVFYAALALEHPDWILIITGPLVLEAVLYYLSWRQSRHKQRTIQTA